MYCFLSYYILPSLAIALKTRNNQLSSDSNFEYDGRKMKAIHVQRCTHFDDHLYVFAKEQK